MVYIGLHSYNAKIFGILNFAVLFYYLVLLFVVFYLKRIISATYVVLSISNSISISLNKYDHFSLFLIFCSLCLLENASISTFWNPFKPTI
ncbi:hypothetical protein CDL12_14226 [Handroanthus impetiginosus]|uniref:Uncharacterized protein n=1 Tax=Handroanthus impetiginosus TaxID=429701 RepID=A0A2G9H6K8_9LAMI|nr:hypothetical protein CDL12_14226 [Handroanthus impetiginosus]